MRNMFIVFFLFAAVCAILLLIGLIRPGTVLFWKNGWRKTRKKVLLIYGLSMLGFYAAFVATVPDMPPEEQAGRELKQASSSESEMSESEIWTTAEPTDGEPLQAHDSGEEEHETAETGIMQHPDATTDASDERETMPSEDLQAGPPDSESGNLKESLIGHWMLLRTHDKPMIESRNDLHYYFSDTKFVIEEPETDSRVEQEYEIIDSDENDGLLVLNVTNEVSEYLLVIRFTDDSRKSFTEYFDLRDYQYNKGEPDYREIRNGLKQMIDLLQDNTVFASDWVYINDKTHPDD